MPNLLQKPAEHEWIDQRVTRLRSEHLEFPGCCIGDGGVPFQTGSEDTFSPQSGNPFRRMTIRSHLLYILTKKILSIQAHLGKRRGAREHDLFTVARRDALST